MKIFFSCELATDFPSLAYSCLPLGGSLQKPELQQRRGRSETTVEEDGSKHGSGKEHGRPGVPP